MRAELLATVKALDPTPLDAQLPTGAWPSEIVLQEIERRIGMDPRESSRPSTVTSRTQQQERMPTPAAPGPVFETQRRRAEDGRRTRSVLVGALAFVVVLLTAVATLGIVRWLDHDTGISVAGISGDPGAAEAFEAIEAAYVAFNARDAEKWVAARDADTSITSRFYTEALFAADASIDVSQCISHGFGDWSGVTGYRFTCEATETNAFYAPAELDTAVSYEWVVADGQVVQAGSNESGFDDWLRFNTDFRNWMRESHPDIHSGMQFLGMTTDFPAAESMPTALEYVVAFVQDSPDWPRPSGS